MPLSSWLRSKLTNRSSLDRRPRRPAGVRLRLEALEDRQMLSFTQTASYQVGDNADAVLAADFNGDGKVDLITANAGQMDSTYGGGPSVSVLLAKSGNKTGFELPRSFPTYDVLTSLVAGDVDGDFRVDLVANHGNVLLGNGDGSFRNTPNYDPGIGDVVALGDFNHDGKLDLLTVDGLLKGDGDGTFGNTSVYGDPYADGGGYRTPGEAMALGHFNNDTNLDLIVASSDAATGSASASLLLGNGNGAFGAPQTILSLASLADEYWEIKAVAVADFNKDSRPDVALAYARYVNEQSTSSSVSVDTFQGNGNGTFTWKSNSALGVSFYSQRSQLHDPMQLAAADFNGDGKLDLITVGRGSSAASLLTGKGDGTFAPFQTIPLSSSSSTYFAVADFNNDGYADLAVLRQNISISYVDLFLNDKQWGTKGTRK